MKSENALYQYTVPELGYEGVKERIYSPNHPDVLQWESFFNERLERLQIFQKFDSATPNRSKSKSRVTSVQWHRFSEVGPWFECQAAALVSCNHMRHFLVQVAFEELGMRDENEIHPDLFWQASRLVGVTDLDRVRLSGNNGVGNALEFLKTSLLACKSDGEVLGMLLGLELPARENIETLFQAMAYDVQAEQTLSATKFFKIHRFIEIEHIRLSIANFMRFCSTESEKNAFIKGCDSGLQFWSLFWTGVAELVHGEEKHFND